MALRYPNSEDVMNILVARCRQLILIGFQKTHGSHQSFSASHSNTADLLQDLRKSVEEVVGDQVPLQLFNCDMDILCIS